MATNPRIPDDQNLETRERRPQLVRNAPKAPRPGSGVPGVLLGIAAAVALIAAILYYMPRVPKKTPPPTAAEVPIQPNGNELQFSNLQMILAPTGNAMRLDGQVMNTGGRSVLGATVQLAFHDANGKVLAVVDQPLMGMARRGNGLASDEFGTDPIKPNQPRLFRVNVGQIPAGWNHQLPDMKVLTVSAEGSR